MVIVMSMTAVFWDVAVGWGLLFEPWNDNYEANSDSLIGFIEFLLPECCVHHITWSKLSQNKALFLIFLVNTVLLLVTLFYKMGLSKCTHLSVNFVSSPNYPVFPVMIEIPTTRIVDIHIVCWFLFFVKRLRRCGLCVEC